MNQENHKDGKRPNVSPVNGSSRGARTLIIVVKAVLLFGFLVVAFALKFKTRRNLLPLSTFGLMFGLFLFGRPGQGLSVRNWSLRTPEQVLWFLAALLAIATVLFA
jgi:predicted neutral ceramidase superfamily lipid hydrolase